MVGRAAALADVRLTLLVTSPRVAPGLMSWSAWRAVAAAPVFASSPDLPVVRAVSAAGYPVEIQDAGRLLFLGDDAVWLASDAEAETLPTTLAAALVAGSPVEVEVLHASYDVPGARLLDLVTVMDRLRVECPWDREQTHRSLARYLLEETYETLEAIETGDLDHLREELGDLLLQVYFHARIASENEPGFSIDEVAGGIVEKLVRRHPHVFAGLEVAGAEEVERNWDEIKAVEKGRASVLDGIPPALPALALADKVLGRAAKASHPVTSPLLPTLGDQLLALVVEARVAGQDAEQELRDAVRRLSEAIRAAGG